MYSYTHWKQFVTEYVSEITIFFVLTRSARQTKSDNFAKNVDPDETARNELFYQDLHCLAVFVNFCLFRLNPLFAISRHVHYRRTRMKESLQKQRMKGLVWRLFMSVSRPVGNQLVCFACSSSPVVLFITQRSPSVVSVESSSLLHYRLYPWFIYCSLWFMDELEDFNADRTNIYFITKEAEGKLCDRVKLASTPYSTPPPPPPHKPHTHIYIYDRPF